MHPGGVNDVPESGRAARGHRRMAERDFSDAVAFALYCAVVGASNRSGDAASELEIRGGGVHDGVGVLLDDISFYDRNFIPEIHLQSLQVYLRLILGGF